MKLLKNVTFKNIFYRNMRKTTIQLACILIQLIAKGKAFYNFILDDLQYYLVQCIIRYVASFYLKIQWHAAPYLHNVHNCIKILAQIEIKSIHPYLWDFSALVEGLEEGDSV